MEKEVVFIRFFKPNGTYYAGCSAELPIWVSDPGYKQAIVDNQITLAPGWQDNDWIVVTSAVKDDHKGFHEKVFLPFSFKGMKQTKKEDLE